MSMENPSGSAPSFREALRVWWRIGWLSFGGPTGQIALMHTELVERRRWIGEGRFLHALNYCMLLPGPEAQQLAVYIGWLLHGLIGGMVAGALFVLPGALVLWGLSWLYVEMGDVPAVEAVFHGLKPAVMAIVAAAVWRIGRRVLKNPVMWVIAAAAWLALGFANIPFPFVIAGAGLTGLLGGRFLPRWFLVLGGHGENKGGADAVVGDTHGTGAIGRASAAGAVRTAVFWILVWLAPVILCRLTLGAEHTLSKEGVFFSKAAVITFGGAYAVLPYVAQHAVEAEGWLSQAQMLDGLGLAETTPGPLVLVLEFVGFLGGWQAPGDLPRWLAATLGAGMVLWTTFVPSFLFIFVGAPFIEALRGQKLLTGALSAITAAVVGVILNLAVWFGLAVIRPAEGPVDLFAVVVSSVVLVGLVLWKWDVLRVVLGCGLAGLVYDLVT